MEIVRDIYLVGVVDWTIRDFHGLKTKKGTTYNSYLIKDEKIVLIDTVKKEYYEQLIDNISKYSSLDKIDYIVINHAEPDHASSLPLIIDKCKKAKIICTEKCKRILEQYYEIKGKFKIIKDGEKISIGKKNLKFFETPMLHWPESMVTYLVEDKILFSMDAFGQHICFSRPFDEENDKCEIFEEAKKYYATIVMPFGEHVKKTLKKLKNIEIKLIATAHGVIWKKYINEIISLYADWADFKAKEKVVIIYDTMWQSTELMAEALAQGMKGGEVKLLHVRKTGLTELVTEVLDAKILAIGSATLNLGIMPQLGAFLIYLKGLRPKNKLGFVFGSYGWNKSFLEDLTDFLKKMNIEIIEEPIISQWKPSEEILQKCKITGKKLMKRSKNL